MASGRGPRASSEGAIQAFAVVRESSRQERRWILLFLPSPSVEMAGGGLGRMRAFRHIATQSAVTEAT